jgi:hypothetical protein
MVSQTEHPQLPRGRLVQLIRAERPEWAARGIEAAVGRGLERWPAEIVLRAGLAAARDQSARTPAVIPSRCEHEHELMASGARPALGGELAARRAPVGPLPPDHCGRESCACTHLDCEAGWLEQLVDRTSGEARPEDGTRPCPTCRPGLAARAREANDWRAARNRRLEELAATRDDPARRQLLEGVRAELRTRRAAHRNTTTTSTTQEGMTA